MSARSASSGLTTVSTLGDYLISWDLRDLDERLITHLVLSIYGVPVGELEACFSRRSFWNLRCWRSLVIWMTCRVFGLILSSTSAAPSVERADIMLWAVASASLLTSFMALWVSLLLSFTNDNEITKAWIPTVKKRIRRPVHQWTADGHLKSEFWENNEDRNPPITADYCDTYGGM